MAKDRAKDPKRIPNLGIDNPISHVKVIPAQQEDRHDYLGRKYGYEWANRVPDTYEDEKEAFGKTMK
jgi:hypothetical protein